MAAIQFFLQTTGGCWHMIVFFSLCNPSVLFQRLRIIHLLRTTQCWMNRSFELHGHEQPQIFWYRQYGWQAISWKVFPVTSKRCYTHWKIFSSQATRYTAQFLIFNVSIKNSVTTINDAIQTVPGVRVILWFVDSRCVFYSCPYLYNKLILGSLTPDCIIIHSSFII